MLCHLRNLGQAFALSTAAIVVALVGQAMLLVCVPVASPVHFQSNEFRCVSICDDGRTALMLVREPGEMDKDSVRYSMACFSTITSPTPLRLPTQGLTVWRTTGASRGPLGFVATTAGDLYSLDLAARSAPVRLGRHQEKLPYVLECTDDGALLLAAGEDSISCWDRAAARCLWKRNDTRLCSGKFVPGTQRLFAALETGPIVELGACSGRTLREHHNHRGPFFGLDIAADGQRLAAIDFEGACVVSALATGAPLWSRKFPAPGATPRFSPDGSILVAADQQRRPRVLLLSAASGDLLGELTGAQAEIVGLTVTRLGAIYAWDLSGTVTVWDLVSRSLRFQFHPGKST
jgi:hypothetical protein